MDYSLILYALVGSVAAFSIHRLINSPYYTIVGAVANEVYYSSKRFIYRIISDDLVHHRIGQHIVHSITRVDFGQSPVAHWKTACDPWDVPCDGHKDVHYAIRLSHMTDVHPKRKWTQFVSGKIYPKAPFPFNAHVKRVSRADIQHVAVSYIPTSSGGATGETSITIDITDSMLDFEGLDNNFGGATVTLGQALKYIMDPESLNSFNTTARFFFETLDHKHNFTVNSTLHDVDVAFSASLGEGEER